MRLYALLSTVLFALPAAAQTSPSDRGAPVFPGPVARWSDVLRKEMPRHQRPVQFLEGDLDGDGVKEWIVVGEAEEGGEYGPSLSIFAPPKGGVGPELRWAQHMRDPELQVSGAMLSPMQPVGEVVVWVGAAPGSPGRSRFVVQIVGWTGEDFRPFVPETAEFESHGGFAIVPSLPPRAVDDLLVWTELRGPGTLVWDGNLYVWRRWRWDGTRYAVQYGVEVTEGRYTDPEAAGREAGAPGDMRRQIDRVANLP